MDYPTRMFLLIIALTVGGISGYSQESKTKAPSSAPVGPPPPAVEYDLKAWKEYSSSQGRFTATFPGTPTDENNSSDADGGFEGRAYMLRTSAVYAIYYTDVPVGFPHDLEKEEALRKQVFDNAREQIIAHSKGKALSETDIALDGHPGRMTKVATPDGSITRSKEYIVGRRIYQIIVVTPRELLAPDGGRFDETRATKFLDSFKLAKPEKGEGVKP